MDLIKLLLFLAIAACPVIANQIKNEQASEQDFEEMGLHYGKYLKEVVAALDKDQKFTETIKNMDTNDIKSGKVADQLKHVHADIRKKLNDLKYVEIQRLREAATRKNEMEQFGETYHGTDKRKWRTLGASMDKLPDHIGSHATYFDVDDLHKLMVAATNDLEKLDKDRREDYKTYEMEKEWQFEERLKTMNETEKQEAIKMREQLRQKHDNHPKVHEPGSKKQFEEVWEKSDKLPVQEFDPKTFFALHDTNSDGHWDQGEVRSLLHTEISKVYDPNNAEDDPNEMNEEYERMREHIYKEIDLDRDGLISKKEFIDYSRKPEFARDAGWDDVNKQKVYSQQDYEDYTKNREKMIHQMHGHYDPSYYANQPSNLHLPDWGYGMPAGAHPAQYYGYHVDPNHPQAQHIAAQQMAAHHQAAAYQQAAYQQAAHQQAAAGQIQPAGGYQQVAPSQQYQQPAAIGGQVQQGGYQQMPNNQQYHQPMASGQMPQQQQQQQQQQAGYQQVPTNQQYQQPAASGQIPQGNYQQAPPANQQYQQPAAAGQIPQGGYQQVSANQQYHQQVPQQQVPQQQIPQQQNHSIISPVANS